MFQIPKYLWDVKINATNVNHEHEAIMNPIYNSIRVYVLVIGTFGSMIGTQMELKCSIIGLGILI